MEKQFRNWYNREFSTEKYSQFLKYFPDNFGVQIPFRIAESPIFMDENFKKKIIHAGNDIIEKIFSQDVLDFSLEGIPNKFRVPGPMGNPNFLAIDFGICADENGLPSPRLIELQGFPSLYCFQPELGKAYKKVFDIPDSWNQYFHPFQESSYFELLRKNILGDYSKEEVILLEIDPWNQPTSIDFAICRELLGIDVVDIQNIILENNKLFYYKNGSKKIIRRIYNRVIFDELNRKTKDLNLNYHLTEPAEVEWAIHPNWFFRFSKFLLPRIQSEFNPECIFLKELQTFPPDLENYVLKPLFSFSGEGIIFDLKEKDLVEIQDKENYILQKKVSYLPLIESPHGGVKAEVRLLYLWDDIAQKPVMVTNLCRLSRGDMIGVKYNKEKTWVGGSVALFQ